MTINELKKKLRETASYPSSLEKCNSEKHVNQKPISKEETENKEQKENLEKLQSDL